MLRIRKETKQAMDLAAYENFQQRMVKHVNDCFPEVCAKMTPEQIEAQVKQGLKNGRSHGLTGQRDLTKFLNLVFVFGPEFENDPNLPWAKQILDNPAIQSPGAKIVELESAAMEHLEQQEGKNKPSQTG